MTDNITNRITIELKCQRKLSDAELNTITRNIDEHVQRECRAGIEGFAAVEELTVSGDYLVNGKLEKMMFPTTIRKEAA